MGLITIGGLPVERPVSLRGVAIDACVDRYGNVIWRYEPGGGEPGGGDEPETVFIPYTFVAVSDAHYYSNMANEKARLTSWCTYMEQKLPDMILATGDLSNGSVYSGALSVFSDTLKKRLHWAWGNHECNASSLEDMCNNFDDAMGTGASKTHWFDMQGDRFIIMHFRTYSRNRAQFTYDDLTELQNALNSAGERRVFLIQHCPDFSRTMCGASGKGDTMHWGYDAPDIEWNGETLDVREIFRRIVDAHVLAHPGKLIWLHGHTHKPVNYNANWDDTYFSGNGWTVHIPSLGRPYVSGSGEDSTIGEWAVFTVSRDAVSVSYRHVEGTSVTDDTVEVLSGYGFDIPCAGIGVPAEDGGTWSVRLVGGELYVDEAPVACVRMDVNELILEDAG